MLHSLIEIPQHWGILQLQRYPTRSVCCAVSCPLTFLKVGFLQGYMSTTSMGASARISVTDIVLNMVYLARACTHATTVLKCRIGKWMASVCWFLLDLYRLVLSVVYIRTFVPTSHTYICCVLLAMYTSSSYPLCFPPALCLCCPLQQFHRTWVCLGFSYNIHCCFLLIFILDLWWDKWGGRQGGIKVLGDNSVLTVAAVVHMIMHLSQVFNSGGFMHSSTFAWPHHWQHSVTVV